MVFIQRKMALHYDLPVYKDVYALIRELFACTANFSQAYKYNLGQDIKRTFSLPSKEFIFYPSQEYLPEAFGCHILSLSERVHYVLLGCTHPAVTE